MSDYFSEAKKRIEEQIPEFESQDFKKMRDKIKKELQHKEAEISLLRRRLKILILGDWKTKEDKECLLEIKNCLLANGLYAETIDSYYDTRTKSGLSQRNIFEICCINHQLIVFIDGEGPGTVTGQNYLTDNYIFQGKVIFFIKESKFNSLNGNPSEYISMFPTIISYKAEELKNAVLVYARLRIYRLAEIILRQQQSGKGTSNPDYKPWKERLGKKGNRP